jgi:signal peptidase I
MASERYTRDAYDDRGDDPRTRYRSGDPNGGRPASDAYGSYGPSTGRWGEPEDERGTQRRGSGLPGGGYVDTTASTGGIPEQRPFSGDAATGRGDWRTETRYSEGYGDDPHGGPNGASNGNGRSGGTTYGSARDRFNGTRGGARAEYASGSYAAAPQQRGPESPVRGGDESVDAPSFRSKVRNKRKNMPLWQELPLLLIVAFCLAVLIRTFLVQAFYIPSGSMEDTLLVGDRVLVNKIIYDVRQPARGEIVVFTGPSNWAPENQPDTNAGFFAKLGRTVGDLVGVSQPGEKDFIKRVIGLPGDVVACCDVQGRVTVNGYSLDEASYVTENSPIDVPPNPRECRSRRFEPITVQPGMMWVMGDHRLVSQDSRCQGQVPIDNVIGRAFVILWPSARWAWLEVPKTFQNVPKPYSAAPLPGPVRPPGNSGRSAPHGTVDALSPVSPGSTVLRPANDPGGDGVGILDVAFLAPIAASLAVPARSGGRGSRKRRRLRP